MTDKQRQVVQNTLRLNGLIISAGKGPVDVMTTRWGGITKMWNREVFVLPVRKNKMMCDLIGKSKCFVVNVPQGDLDSIIAKCDNMQGKETVNIEEVGLSVEPAKSIPTSSVNECNLVLECKVIFSAKMNKGNLNKVIAQDMYINKETHMLFFGEIINTYMH